MATSLGRQGVVLSRAPAVALAPARLEKAGALHLMQRRIERSFLHLELLGASPFGFLKNLVAIHRALAEERQNQHADSSGEEFAIVVHA